MRREDPLILGAGPAGCAAAIVLARGGAEPVLLDRNAEVGDALCGGFLSWRTSARLARLGIDIPALGGHPARTLALFAGRDSARAPLPGVAYGLSRHALDTAMREAAVAAGAKLEIDTVREVEGRTVTTKSREWLPDTLFLASGKHDVRGAARPRSKDNPALGLRIRIPASPALAETVGDAIELHLFEQGYAGIVLQEDGSANICLALRKERLAQADADPHELLAQVAARHPAFAERLQGDWRTLPVDTVGSVPYGWIAQDTAEGVYRLGDQAAVIPSLAGEGMAIAVASGVSAAETWLRGGAGAARHWQSAFARRAARPVRAAKAAWTLAEHPALARLALPLARIVPSLLRPAMRMTRID